MPITEKTTSNTVGNDDIRTDGDAVATQEAKRLTSIESIWNNPNAGITSCNRQQSYPTGQRRLKYPEYVNATTNNPTGTGEVYRYNFLVREARDPSRGDRISNGDVNSAVTATNKFRTRATTVGLGLAGTDLTGVSPGAIIKKLDVNQFITQWSAITSLLDAKNVWYDGNNLCARSCQVACQTACQTSCQGCNVSQCHNQKCGVH